MPDFGSTYVTNIIGQFLQQSHEETIGIIHLQISKMRPRDKIIACPKSQLQDAWS